MNTLSFNIPPVSRELEAALRRRIDDKTKPIGSLGKLEDFVLRLGLMQGTLTPELKSPVVLVFAGDHGLAGEGASPYPPEVTKQMVLNYLGGGAAINAFTRQHRIAMKVIDAGVASDLPSHADLLPYKIRRGTRNALVEAALTPDEVELGLVRGAKIATAFIAAGHDALLLGEMGIGNTAVSALLISSLLGLPLDECVGRGAGHDDQGLARKQKLCAQVRLRRGEIGDARAALSAYGGCEIAMMAGAMLAAAQARKLVVVDGFISTAAAVVASRIHPGVLDYCVFSHASAESGHAKALHALGMQPLVDLGFRLGEGTGAAVVWPLLVSATVFLREMATFSSAGVSEASVPKN